MFNLALIGAAAIAAQSDAPVTAAAPGPAIELMVMTEVNADRNKAGDPVKLRVNKPVTLPDGTAVPVGTPAFGEVLSLTRSGIALQPGKLAIRIVRLSLNGRDIPLSGEMDTTGHGGKGDDAYHIATVPLAPITAIYVLFAPGHSAKFKAGDIIDARLAETAN